MNKPFVIALEGFAASGKRTLAEMIAANIAGASPRNAPLGVGTIRG